MLERDKQRALQGLQQCCQSSPAPFDTYAAEIASIYLDDSAVRKQRMVTPSQVVAFLETTQWDA